MFQLRSAVRALAATALLVSSSTLAPAQEQLNWISATNFGHALEYANGDKVAVGRFNTLHTVWEDGALIKYSTSSDGYSWSTPELVAPGVPAAMPAIASDSNGTLVVVFVANPNAQGLGTIQMARKEWGAAGWGGCQLVDSGTQPDVHARSGKTHVTWTTINRVQYMQFPTASPPASVAFGEEIEVTACPGTGFVRPSVTVVRENCDPIVKVAYLRYSDETSNPDPVCASLITEVGPRVCSRDGAGAWSLEWDSIITATAPPQGVEAISLSLNSHYSSGHKFLAWSDTSNGASRTVLGRGLGGTWFTETLNTEATHVHIQSDRRSQTGRFRTAWVERDASGFIEFFDWNAAFRTGQWTSGGALNWEEASPVIIAATTGGATVGRPQATFWRRCHSGVMDTVEVVANVEGVCATMRIMNHMTANQTCPPAGPYGIDPCMYELMAVKYFAGMEESWIDTSELGDLVHLAEGRATYRNQLRETVNYTRLEWSSGRVIESSEGLLKLDSPEATVRAQATRQEVRVERLGRTDVYERAIAFDECGRK